MINKRFILLLVMVTTLLLTGCQSRKQESGEQNQSNYLDKIHSIEEYKMKEESYLFHDDEFTIYFPYDISFIDHIKEIQLYKNNDIVQSVENKADFDVVDSNKLTIRTEGKNKNFNHIRIIDNNNRTIKLDTGMFLFDGKDHSDEIPVQKQIDLLGSSLNQKGTKVFLKYELTRIDGAEVRFKVPDSLVGVVSKSKMEKVEEKKNSNIYEITLDINKSYYEEQDLYNVSFEVIVEESINGKKSSISKALLPINIDDMKS